MARVLIPGPDDTVLLGQLPDVVRAHNASYAEALGLPAAPLDPIERGAVEDWLARYARRDPDMLIVLAVEDEGIPAPWDPHSVPDRVTGAIIADHVGEIVETKLITSLSLRMLHEMWTATVAWARACGARHILGMTPIGRPLCHHGEAFAQAVGPVHVRDLLLWEAEPCA